MVSLSALIGDNGILTNATKAIDETGLAGAKEAFELALDGAMADYYSEKIKGNTKLTSSEYITIAMIRSGLGSSYQYCSVNSSAENTADDNKTLNEIYNENGGIIYLSKKGSTGSGTIYKITFDIVDGDIANISVTTMSNSISNDNDIETDDDSNDICELVGHSYGEPLWEWAEDCSSAQATFICGNDETHIVVVDADITSMMADDTITYTATVTGPDGAVYTDTKTE